MNANAYRQMIADGHTLTAKDVRTLCDEVDALQRANRILDDAAKDAQHYAYQLQEARDELAALRSAPVAADGMTPEQARDIAEALGLPGGYFMARFVLEAIQKLKTDLNEARAELDTARAALVEQIEARKVTEAEGGALQQANNEIDRLQAELARLRSAGQRRGECMSADKVTQGFDAWFDSHYSEWLRMMKSCCDYSGIKHLRGISQVAWDACFNEIRSAPVAVEVPELRSEELLSVFARVEVDVENSGGCYGVWEAKRLTEWFRERIKPIPSDRVLKEGEREELELLRNMRDEVVLYEWDADPRGDGDPAPHRRAVGEIIGRLDSLRSQRAAEGG